MNTLLIVVAALTAAPLAALAQARVAPPADEFRFRFQPPDGTRVQVTYRMERTRTIDGQPPTRDEAETLTEGVFRQVGPGFEYSPKTLSAVARRNGAALNDPIVGLLSKIPVTYVISKGGEATEIQGFGEVEPLLKSTMPAPLAAALAPMLNEAALVAQQKAEWNARYVDFTEGTFKIGDVIDGQAPYRLPNGETIHYTVRTTFQAWEPCPAGHCIRLTQAYESDTAALANLAQALVGRVVGAASAPPAAPLPKPGATRVTGSLVRLIDPTTMLIYAEQLRRTVAMTVQVPGQGAVPTVQEESRSYTYTYP